jgi:hypothetical protein
MGETAFAAGSESTSVLGWAHALLAGLLIPSPSPTRTLRRRIAARWQNDEKHAPAAPPRMAFSLPCHGGADKEESNLGIGRKREALPRELNVY